MCNKLPSEGYLCLTSPVPVFPCPIFLTRLSTCNELLSGCRFVFCRTPPVPVSPCPIFQTRLSMCSELSCGWCFCLTSPIPGPPRPSFHSFFCVGWFTPPVSEDWQARPSPVASKGHHEPDDPGDLHQVQPGWTGAGKRTEIQMYHIRIITAVRVHQICLICCTTTKYRFVLAITGVTKY